MVRETGNRCVSHLREADAQLFRNDFGIFPVGLIEIAYTEEQYRVWILGLHLLELLF